MAFLRPFHYCTVPPPPLLSPRGRAVGLKFLTRRVKKLRSVVGNSDLATIFLSFDIGPFWSLWYLYACGHHQFLFGGVRSTYNMYKYTGLLRACKDMDVPQSLSPSFLFPQPCPLPTPFPLLYPPSSSSPLSAVTNLALAPLPPPPPLPPLAGRGRLLLFPQNEGGRAKKKQKGVRGEGREDWPSTQSGVGGIRYSVNYLLNSALEGGNDVFQSRPQITTPVFFFPLSPHLRFPPSTGRLRIYSPSDKRRKSLALSPIFVSTKNANSKMIPMMLAVRTI